MKRNLFVTLLLFIAVLGNVFAQQRTITGTVTSSEDGSPLPGATIVVKGTSIGAITDAKGNYTINVPSSAEVLEYSFVGMSTQDIPIAGKRVINIIMKPTTTAVKEVVVTALGIKREQKALGYAVSTIKADELVKTGADNFGSALYGKAAGVRIQTAPGGPTSAVSINVRGMNSINFNNQPLIIVDGIPIHNEESNNSGYWGDQRIRGNGLLDINPDDIASISILKGASASALYGSEAANGVIVVTTKHGQATKGLGIDVNYQYMVEKPAFGPTFQNEYGPGYDLVTNQSFFGADEDGWIYEDLNGDGTAETPRPIYRSYAQFGPKFDGRKVIGWDNKMHPYVAQPDNWNNLFRTGSSSEANIAFNKVGKFGNLRFSYTHLDYNGVQRGGRTEKNTFNLNTSLKTSKNLTFDLTMNYVNQYVLNRPYKISRITNNFGGFFSRFDDMQWYLDNYQTSEGYGFRTGNQTSATPDENLQYRMRATDLLDFFWRTMKNRNEEYTNRLISSATACWTIFNGLSFRGRIANDYTAMNTENRSYTQVPLSIGNSGGFNMGQNKYSILYGDALLTFNKKITRDFGLLVNAGFQGRQETSSNVSVGTRGGLSTENWFSLNASVNTGTKNGSGSYTQLLRYAYLGTVGMNYRDLAFLEFTGRQEASSTLPPGSNNYFYPSVNASFIFSDAFSLPSFIEYGKIRASYGIVGNAPPIYAANNAFNQGSINGIIYNTVPGSYGNDKIRPEKKKEIETGIEMKFLQNRLGFNFTYYTNHIVDEILWLTVPTSVGAGSMLTNVGELANHGYEASLYFTPVRNKDIEWTVRTNFAINRNEVVKLMEGVDRLTHSNIDAGAAMIVSEPGQPMGDILAYLPKKNDQGQYIVNDPDGLYEIDFSKMKKVGNVTPDIVGGIGSYFNFKGIYFDFGIDYRFGGSIISLASQYMKGAGMFKETLKYRDAEHGGIAYYINGSGDKVATDQNAGPNGEKIFHDGIILPGVKSSDGSTNDIIVDAPSYYLNTFTWGANPAWGIPYSRYDDAVRKNNYIKLRELSIGYNLPKSLTQKMKFNDIRISLVGYNLLYIYRTFKDFDAETTIGTNWVHAAVVGGSTSATRSIGISIRTSF